MFEKDDDLFWSWLNENDIQFEMEQPGFFIKKKFIPLTFGKEKMSEKIKEENILRCSQCEQFEKELYNRYLFVDKSEYDEFIAYVICSNCISSIITGCEVGIFKLLNKNNENITEHTIVFENYEKVDTSLETLINTVKKLEKHMKNMENKLDDLMKRIENVELADARRANYNIRHGIPFRFKPSGALSFSPKIEETIE